MARDRHERLLTLLRRDGGWVTGTVLADALGVTPRSVRSYVTAINARSIGRSAVLSGPQGYRLDSGWREAVARGDSDSPQTPEQRAIVVIRQLLASDDQSADVFAMADRLYVSPSTMESDLARVRSLIAPDGLLLERTGSRVTLRGEEAAIRSLIGRIIDDALDQRGYDGDGLRRALGAQAVGAEALSGFTSAVVADLGERGYFVNEYGLSDVMMHVGIAVDRVARDRTLAAPTGETNHAEHDAVAAVIAERSREHFEVELPAAEVSHLALMMRSRVVSPGADSDPDEAVTTVASPIRRAVAEAVADAAEEFLVELDDEVFVSRLALHVERVALRGAQASPPRNPLTRSLKTTFPMIFEIAVYLAARLQDTGGIVVTDDEIAYIAMHVGGQLERSRRPDDPVTATLVCPNYYDLHDQLRDSVSSRLSESVRVIEVATGTDPAWSQLRGEIVLSTIEPPTPTEQVIVIPPFLSEGDADRVRQAVARVRRARRLARLRAELQRYFAADAFVRPLPDDAGEEQIIRLLGAPLVEAGIVDEDYVRGAIEREQMSSTAFTDALAVPHALGMSATRTTIAVGIAPKSIAWGDGRVQVVALAAFSETDRAAFQTVFEPFVEVFSEREPVQRIVRKGIDFASFIDELAAVIDD